MMEVLVATAIGLGIGCILVLALVVFSEAIDRAIIRRLQMDRRLMEAKRQTIIVRGGNRAII